MTFRDKAYPQCGYAQLEYISLLHIRSVLAEIAAVRNSPLKHPLAVLRTTIGLGQKQLADMLQCSAATVQAIELGKLPLSSGMAEKIVLQTGVSLEWLLAGDPKAPIVSQARKPYTREAFENFAAQKSFGLAELPDVLDASALNLFYVLSALLQSFRQGPIKHALCSFKLSRALLPITEEFGLAGELQEPLLECIKGFTQLPTSGSMPKGLTPLCNEFFKQMLLHSLNSNGMSITPQGLEMTDSATGKKMTMSLNRVLDLAEAHAREQAQSVAPATAQSPKRQKGSSTKSRPKTNRKPARA